jgi:hypothetical protein
MSVKAYMRRARVTVALFVLSVLSTHAQTSEPSNSPNGSQPGRIMGTVVNDEGDPVKGATLCTRVKAANGESTSCGATQTDENGKFEISQLPLAKIDVYAQAEMQGYWQDASTPRKQTVTLTTKAPIAHVALSAGPKPGELIVNVMDKTTGKAVHSFFVTLIGDTAGFCSGTGNFRQAGASGVRVPIPPATDVIVEVSAEGYKNWFYTDPSDSSRPVLRLESGEEKVLEAELEPK